MLHTIEQSLLIFLIVIGVLAFRLTAGNGFHLIYRYLPKAGNAGCTTENAPPPKRSTKQAAYQP